MSAVGAPVAYISLQCLKRYQRAAVGTLITCGINYGVLFGTETRLMANSVCLLHRVWQVCVASACCIPEGR